MVNLTFGEQVKIILSRKGMTIKELAEQMEAYTGKPMSRQNMTQRLHRDNFQEQDMRLIAKILGCVRSPLYNLAYVLQAIIDKQGEGAPAAAEAPAAEPAKPAAPTPINFEKEKEETRSYTPETQEKSVEEKTAEKTAENPLDISFGAASDFSSFGNPYIDFVDIEKTAPKESEAAPEAKGSAPEQEKYLFSLSDMTAEQVTKQNIEKHYRILGTAFHAYIFVELDGKIMVVDKHAAHERILFEDMRRILSSSESHSQLLIVPESLTLGSEEFAAVVEYSDDIKAFGFDFEANETGKEISISRVPTGIDVRDALDMLIVIADQLASGTGNEVVTRDSVFEKALYQASCKAAMKAGIADNDTNNAWIVERLFQIPDIKYCPHGRPCTFELSENELEKRFNRT